MSQHDHRSLCFSCNSYKPGEHQEHCINYVAPAPTETEQLAAIRAELFQLRQALESFARNPCCASCREAGLAAKPQVQP